MCELNMQAGGRMDAGFASEIHLWCLTGTLKYAVQHMIERRVRPSSEAPPPSNSPASVDCPPAAKLTWWRPAKALLACPSAAVYPD